MASQSEQYPVYPDLSPGSVAAARLSVLEVTMPNLEQSFGNTGSLGALIAGEVVTD